MNRNAVTSISESSWFGHPRGLTILFLTETWEKFSFFGMRVLLVYYMTKQLLMPQGQASYVYGLYTAFVYLTPILGGMLSDRWLGRRRAIISGATIMAAGHFMMASEQLLYPALATIAIGNGLFLPSLPSQIGTLYNPADPRRGSAYSVYYVGVNLGGFIAPLVCGTLGELYGWHWGFAAAGVGMIIGLLIYIGGSRYLPREALNGPSRAMSEAERPSRASLLQCVLILATIGAVIVVFRGAYEQMGNTVALWADEAVDRSVGQRFIPMTWFQALNPLIVFSLTPLLVAHWAKRTHEGRGASSILKMSKGAAIVALSYLMLALVSYSSEIHGVKTSWLWLAAFVVIMTAGELHILPVGLSLFNRLAPAQLAATTVAAWFLAAFAGNLLAGSLGSLWSQSHHSTFFLLLTGVAAFAALCLRALDRPIRRVEERELARASAAQSLEGQAIAPASGNVSV